MLLSISSLLLLHSNHAAAAMSCDHTPHAKAIDSVNAQPGIHDRCDTHLHRASANGMKYVEQERHPILPAHAPYRSDQFLIKSRKPCSEAISASTSTGSERRFDWISSADPEGVQGIAYRAPSWAETNGIRTDTNIRSGTVSSGTSPE